MSEAAHRERLGRFVPKEDFSGELVAGNYSLRRVIGRGGMATVYEAEQLNLKRPVALKILRPTEHILENDPGCVQRFLREASCGAALRGPHTAAIFDYGTSTLGGDVIWFIAMERLEGHTLWQVLRAATTLAPDRAVRVGLQIAAALSEAHEQGFLHRDLKPGNVFLERDDQGEDQVKVLDFGLVKNLLESEDQELTQHGVLLGSPHYMSPEQVRGHDPTFASDIYALGALLYEMLAGQPPFHGLDDVRVMMAHMTDRPTPLAQRAPGVPAALAKLVDSCLRKAPEDRPQSMEAVRSELEAILESHFRAPSQRPRRLDSYSAGPMDSDPRSLPPLGIGEGSGSLSIGPESVSIPAPSQRPPHRNRATQIAGGILAGLILLLMYAAIMRDEGGVATTVGRGGMRAGPDAPALILRLRSQPQGAEVRFGEHVCQTPCEIPMETVPSGALTFVFVRDGYHPTSVSRHLSAPVTEIEAQLVEK